MTPAMYIIKDQDGNVTAGDAMPVPAVAKAFVDERPGHTIEDEEGNRLYPEGALS